MKSVPTVVWNCGNVTINRDDISNIDPIAFGRNDIEILETNPIWTTRESTNPTHLIDTAKKKAVFEFDFLDPNDGFAVQFLADKADSETRWQTNLQCYGTIKGLTRSPYQVEANLPGHVGGPPLSGWLHFCSSDFARLRWDATLGYQDCHSRD